MVFNTDRCIFFCGATAQLGLGRHVLKFLNHMYLDSSERNNKLVAYCCVLYYNYITIWQLVWCIEIYGAT